jgi:hypothetical protein
MGQVHVVQQGECLTAIAARYGFADGKAIYDAPENAGYRKLRPDPNVILPGDEITIPDRKPKVLTLATGKRHKIVITLPRRKVRVRLDLPDGRSLSGQPFELTVNQRSINGQVAADNIIEAEVRADATEATLLLPKLGLKMRLAVGHLDPVRDGPQGAPVPSGVRARLHNLGFLSASPTGVLDDETKAAVRRFQEGVLGREDADGTLDDETLAKLLDVHGC